MGRSGLSTVLKSLGLLLFSILILVFLIGGSLSPTRQLSGDDSVLDFGGGKAAEFFWITLAVIGVMAVMGIGLGILFYFLTREVTVAKEQENIPTNPLEYRSYGHPMALALAAGFALILLGIYFVVGLMPTQASTQAVITDRIFGIAFVVVAALFGLVMGLFVHSLLFFRADPDDMSDGKHFHGNIPLELTWTFLPLIFVMGLGVYTITQYNDLVEEQEGEVSVSVEGFQWGWRFIYPPETFFDEESYAELDENQREDIQARGGVLVGELVLLADQPVRLDLSSEDVIHSFWIPEMRVKQDVVPGVDTLVRYTPTLPGDYKVRCAELCGLTHWNMLASVRVLSQGDYDKWLNEIRASYGDPEEAGRLIWQANCQTCHTASGASGTGPTWKDLVGSERQFENGDSVIADFDYVINSIYDPNGRIVRGFSAGLMPSNFAGSISEFGVRQVYAYMCSISVHADSDPTCVEIQAEIDASEAAAEEDASSDTTDDATDTTEGDENSDTSDETDSTTEEAPQDNDILG